MPKPSADTRVDASASTRTRHAVSAHDVGVPAGGAQPARPVAMLLGRYRVIAARGTGGFGRVLVCWDTLLQRRVAIKQIPVAVPGAASTTMTAALAEARTSSLLSHQGIVTVYDFQSDDDYAYLVMEYVDGLTLAELLQRVEGGTLTPDEVCHVTSSLAKALAYAHVNGVLHLDIKPTNVMINASGEVKLCDFGMATLASAAGYGGARGGTVGYMPPEQIRGELVDERSDVFSLAVVVWQMLSGASPFAATSAEASLRLMERSSHRRLSKHVPEAAAIDEVMAAALAFEPSMRTSSVEAFADDLVRGLGDERAGARSVASLLRQATDDEDGEDGLTDDLSLSFRFPWLSTVIVRGSSAVLSACAAFAPLSHLLTTHPTRLVIALVSVGAVAAAWPSAGSLLVAVTLLVALANPPVGAAAVMLPGLAAFAFLLWWSIVARGNAHATAAMLAPVVLSAPAAASQVAGACLSPARAAVTAGAAWAFAELHAVAVASDFVASPAAHALFALLVTPSAWVSVMGAVLSAALVAALTRNVTSVSGAMGVQVLGAAALAGSQLFATSMENGGNVVAPSWSTVGVAVVLCMIMGVVFSICGIPLSEESAHELH